MAFLDWSPRSRRRAPLPPKPPAREQAAHAGGPLTAQQFIRHVDDYAQSVRGEEIMNAIVAVHSREVKALATLSARLRGRYFARLLDLSQHKGAPAGSEVAELRDLREGYEELERGLDLLKQAAAGGLVKIDGLRN